MNILHMKYAVEVAKAGSINKAAEALFIAQPNLSRAIKELESDLGIIIFDRSAKGMLLTPEGEEFLGYARAILNQINDVEQRYREGAVSKLKFSISVPRSTYISEALFRFSKGLDTRAAEIIYRETNTFRTIKNVMEDGYNLGIIRYAAGYDSFFQEMFKEKGLIHEQVAEFCYVLLMSKHNSLASKTEIRFSDLHSFIEVAHADPYVPSLPMAVVRKEELPNNTDRRIFVFERASQFDLLSENPDTFMWVTPVSSRILQRYELVQRQCPDNRRVYKDVLVYHKGYTLTQLDKRFIAELHDSKKRCLT